MQPYQNFQALEPVPMPAGELNKLQNIIASTVARRPAPTGPTLISDYNITSPVVIASMLRDSDLRPWSFEERFGYSAPIPDYTNPEDYT